MTDKILLRHWWKSVGLILQYYERQVALNLTAELLTVIKRMAFSLADGSIPKFITDAAAKGSPSAGDLEKQDIGYALAYWKACEGRLKHNEVVIQIKVDPHPKKTICMAFGIDESTARGWRHKYKPAFLGVNDTNGEILTARMWKAGERYRGGAGRSNAARLARGRKKKRA
ncbi:hypothetical protein G5V57_18030 [Nordella sp. HKS 07]|uniref:hypothetical protein n=1 Tax=Nordella sp. HKS 07 TaxID=2712222 RepID=UPI0013E0F75C|nr:hypothetical protein [Nordella sp. HKS 07]QIG49448.1 hypothetical protein G5V57_18030 [Nordella sp. HKS 07]